MKRSCWLAVLLLAGCTTLRPPPFQAASSRQALVNWRHGADSLSADVIVQNSADGKLRLIASKGTTLLVLTQIGDEWSATGPMARIGWQGQAAHAPGPLAGWICFAEAIRGKTSAFEIACPENGDRFRAVF